MRSGTANPLPTDRTFTGQEQDGTGLMYFRARYVDPALGTFLSPDTIVPEIGVVADYNRFAYVRGNPLRYADPTGHFSDDEINEYLQRMYGDDWQRMRYLWQMDKVWWAILETAEIGWEIWAGEFLGLADGFIGQFKKIDGKLMIMRNTNTDTYDLWQMQGQGAYDLRGPNYERSARLYSMQNEYDQPIFNYDNQGNIQQKYLKGIRHVFVDVTFFGLGRGNQFSSHETQSPWGIPALGGPLDVTTKIPVVGDVLELTVNLIEYVFQPRFYVTRDNDIYTGGNAICVIQACISAR